MNLVPLSTIFEIEYGNQFDLNKMDFAEADINFVSRSSQNLGVVARVAKHLEIEPYPLGLITVTLGGTYLLSSFVQEAPFYTAQNIKVLTSKRKMDFKEKLFYCIAIRANRFRYTSHGREANVTLNNLLVPEEMPDNFKSVDLKKINTLKRESILNKQDFDLDKNNWKTFDLNYLFKITGSQTTPVLELEEYGDGKYPYVTTQATNNGIEDFYNFYTEKGNILTVDSAVLGYCSYQPENFSASDHVEKLIPNFKMNKYIAMFLVSILNLEQYRYNYGRKCSQSRMRQITIKLPAENGQPNFDFMEDYIKSLPYSKNI